ncbi:Pet20p NDAI_0K01320 [Naumovozyma dairenensis CBS 421]|uniref:Uncharacterized protein n=1 Tax=Naumovozyma dairenensis (strain ATCC 10597 / BCRC 20456 / CBS 421 / NBRC 0211 / NRRL Y-12639) TaxID=1071378 RepID=G0WHR2_NAUDC|nr:hypothetical protein NDAI_0K01320 [Naumovozyma dairenensis CBS 421]CCD27323.1 hypothetical protein NDAI_0K01320 [Naumovozyma dairenensis CBS 421]
MFNIATFNKSSISILSKNSRRFQSSVTFLNNQTLQQQQKNQSKSSKKKHNQQQQHKEKLSLYHTNAKKNIDTSTNNKSSLVNLQRKKVLNFSRLPKITPPSNLRHQDISMKLLYSGYRPLFIPNGSFQQGQKNNGSTLYEFAMKLDEFKKDKNSTIWDTSATGVETFTEWDNVPESVIRNLKPFQKPTSPSHMTTTTTSLDEKLEVDGSLKKEFKKLQVEVFLKKMTDILKRKSKGRKKPIVSLLQLKAKLQNEGNDD